MSELVEGQKEDNKLLEEVNRHIDAIENEFDPKNTTRESFEVAYSFKMQLLYSMARRFHPRSSYGKKMLLQAAAVRKEFEKLIGSYTIYLTKENIAGFSTVLSKDMADEIACGKSFGFGAVRSKGNDAYGVGAIVYEMAEETKGQIDFRVKWLFVNEDFRGRGIVHALLGDLMEAANQNGINHITADIPLSNEWLLVLGNVLSDWRFDMDTKLFSEGIIRVGDIERPPRLAAKVNGVKGLNEVKNTTDTLMVKRFLTKRAYHGYLLQEDLPDDYIDRNLSCFYGDESDPSGMLLAHCTPSGRVKTVFLEGESEEVTVALISYFALAAMDLCDNNTRLFFPVKSEKTGQILDEIFTDQ